MASVKDALAYILKKYPDHMKHELSNARVTKIIYLADWHKTLHHGKQLTNIRWYFDNYGPYVNDIKTEAEADPKTFKIISTSNIYGQPKIMLSLNDNSYEPQLDEDDKNSLDYVIEETQKMYWDTFIKLVYSTYPIATSDRYSYLNLSQKAAEYKTHSAN